jgi:phosphatidylglycerophosphate synthase
MSVLDSVDGKLARLTFESTPQGDVLDHGMDIVHPPFWYWA